VTKATPGGAVKPLSTTNVLRSARRRRARAPLVALATVAVLLAAVAGAPASAQTDPRVGLAPGLDNAGTAALKVDHLGHAPKPAGFFDPSNPGSFAFAGSDLALSGNYAFHGNFNGFVVYDISNPQAPVVKTTVVCPGGQGDLSVYGNLLFMSVEESRARVDCGTDPTVGTRFQGVRIFDISDITNPVQVAAVQACRGSHTHTLVTKPGVTDTIWVYISGTAGVRPATTMAGCNNNPATGENPSRWRIDVIQVQLANPGAAALVETDPDDHRLFRDPATGAIDGLQNAPPTPNHPSGAPWGPTPITDACHDITAFPEIGLAAGACEGNGILINITNPAQPVRVAEVSDPNYAYWHSATFNNDGTKVVFTDEWGGGTGPRCRATDSLSWGADAIFDIVGGQMQFGSYYKMPAAQTVQENCVAHNGSIIPVPGRDIMTQAWYQGGFSVFDFTDSAHPTEIAFFDRGPISPTALVLGGFWSTYWYNGEIVGTEIARGLDVFGLRPGRDLSRSEIEAASEAQMAEFNAQLQSQVMWTPSFAVVGTYFDQAVRSGALSGRLQTQIERIIDRARHLDRTDRPERAAEELRAGAARLTGPGQETLAGAMLDLADELVA
jgi:LVIVD repeat